VKNLLSWFVLLLSIALLLSSCGPKASDNTSESTDNSSFTLGRTFLLLHLVLTASSARKLINW
ncbi:uncharacterized protein METZ01_LOCUS92918, partial [marine metagenome]